jgi:hypothetical protein
LDIARIRHLWESNMRFCFVLMLVWFCSLVQCRAAPVVFRDPFIRCTTGCFLFPLVESVQCDCDPLIRGSTGCTIVNPTGLKARSAVVANDLSLVFLEGITKRPFLGPRVGSAPSSGFTFQDIRGSLSFNEALVCLGCFAYLVGVCRCVWVACKRPVV